MNQSRLHFSTKVPVKQNIIFSTQQNRMNFISGRLELNVKKPFIGSFYANKGNTKLVIMLQQWASSCTGRSQSVII
jgi:hypothetical protein